MDEKQKILSLEEENRLLKEKLEFYEKIINKLPVILYINEVEHQGDMNSIKCIWSNKWATDFIGYEQDEITKMGSDFVKAIMHPDDILETPKSLEFHKNKEEDVYFSLGRLRPKNHEKYHWIYLRTLNFTKYQDGLPKQSLNVAFELHGEVMRANQFVTLLKEINQIHNELKLKSLTNRELEILKLITKGLTDKVIGAILNISIATAKTHRNKVLKKLGFKNTACLVAFAAECGLV